MIAIRQTAAYAKWFDSLRDRSAKARIDVRIRRLFLGNPGDTRSIGESVSELRIDYGPGYRDYFTKIGVIVLLLWWRQGFAEPRYFNRQEVGAKIEE